MRFTRCIALVLACLLTPSLGLAGQLVESGSTLLYPIMTAWAAAYDERYHDVSIATNATGSGTGISEATSGAATLGASDAYLTDAQQTADLLNIPLAISGQHIAYNVAGLESEHVRLTADVLAQIYSGKVTLWSDPAIAVLNPSLQSRLPKETIVPLRRSDSSGDTFLFTEFLTRTAPTQWAPKSGSRIAWPNVPGEAATKGNRELVQLCGAIKNSIAYIGISYLEQTRSAHLGIAALRNRAGKFVTPEADALAAAAAHVGTIPKDGRVSLIDASGDGTYPIANVAYGIVKAHGHNPETLKDLRGFLTWIVDPADGNARGQLDPVHLAPLTESLRAYSRAQIAAVR